MQNNKINKKSHKKTSIGKKHRETNNNKSNSKNNKDKSYTEAKKATKNSKNGKNKSYIEAKKATKTNKNPAQGESNRFLDLTLDAVFKHFFKTDTDLCGDLIKQVVPPLKHQKIKVVKFLDSQLHSQDPKDKNSLLDILVQVNDKELINIEMQCFRKKDFNERVLFYWAKLFILKVKSGEDYEKILPTYSLIFTDYTLFKDLKNYFSSFSLRCDEQPEVLFSEHLKLSLVELNKFKPSKKLSQLDEKGLWCYLLTRSVGLTEEEMGVIASRSKMMKQAVNQLTKVSRDEVLQILADAREKARMDKIAEIAYGREEGLEKGLKKGIKLGRQEGLQAGRQEGRQEGLQTGRQEGLQTGRQAEQTKVVLNMLKEKIDIKLVSKVTGLAVEEIKKLKKQ